MHLSVSGRWLSCIDAQRWEEVSTLASIQLHVLRETGHRWSHLNLLLFSHLLDQSATWIFSYRRALILLLDLRVEFFPQLAASLRVLHLQLRDVLAQRLTTIAVVLLETALIEDFGVGTALFYLLSVSFFLSAAV